MLAPLKTLISVLTPLGWIPRFKTELKRVGNIPDLRNSDQMEENNLPSFITGGDISADGTKIFLRNSKSMF